MDESRDLWVERPVLSAWGPPFTRSPRGRIRASTDAIRSASPRPQARCRVAGSVVVLYDCRRLRHKGVERTLPSVHVVSPLYAFRDDLLTSKAMADQDDDI